MIKPKKLSEEMEKQVISRIQELGPWFHNIEIAQGAYTNPGSEYPYNRWRIIESELPDKLDGKVCLDVGFNSGFFSLKLGKKGAKQVIGMRGEKE